MSLLRPRKEEGKPGRLKRAFRSVYERRDSDPESQGRRITMDIRTGQILGQPPCCDDPLQCERPECWTHIGGAPRGW